MSLLELILVLLRQDVEGRYLDPMTEIRPTDLYFGLYKRSNLHWSLGVNFDDILQEMLGEGA